MSWLDRLENTVFTITTGDGKVFFPLWKSGETSKDFNTSVFDFINQPGSLIDRKNVRARKFPLVFWFQGENNIDQSEAFDQSANDPRAWKVKHPFYGDITGQPLSISRNDNNLNLTEIAVDFWESIAEELPKTKVSIKDAINSKTVIFHTIAPLNYESKVNLKPADLSVVKDNSQKINALISGALDSVNYSDYQLIKNEAFTKIDNLITSPSAAIESINDLILQPAKFNMSVVLRINLIKAVFNSIKSVLGKPTKNNKAYFESNGGAAIMSMSVAIVTPVDGDYITRPEVENSSSELVEIYKEYVDLLDSLYVSISDTTNSFSASSETQSQIKSTVIQTISNLSDLAFEAKQERVTTLQNDSNLILLTHKYMGLDPEDKNIERFRTINNIKNKALFIIKKGRQIKYYV